MNAPRKHHYIPAFYLKSWAGTDSNICEYKRIKNRAVHRRAHPNATGYEVDLYRVEGLAEPASQHLETEFMRLVDTGASAALQKLIQNDQRPWTITMRSSWVRFLLSLLFRNPEAVKAIKLALMDVWNESVDDLRTNYSSRRRTSDPLTFEGYMALTESSGPHKGAARLLQDIIDSRRVGPTIFDMHWRRISLSASSVTLLMSDRPLVMPWGLERQDAYVALPIGPKLLSFAAYNRELARRVEADDPTQVVKSFNEAVVARARTLVWGRP